MHWFDQHWMWSRSRYTSNILHSLSGTAAFTFRSSDKTEYLRRICIAVGVRTTHTTNFIIFFSSSFQTSVSARIRSTSVNKTICETFKVLYDVSSAGSNPFYHAIQAILCLTRQLVTTLKTKVFVGSFTLAVSFSFQINILNSKASRPISKVKQWWCLMNISNC